METEPVSPTVQVTVRVTDPVLSNGFAHPISVKRPFSSSGAAYAIACGHRRIPDRSRRSGPGVCEGR